MSTAANQTQSAQAIGAYLDECSRRFIAAINARLFDDAEAITGISIDENFEGHLPGAPVTYNAKDYVDQYRHGKNVHVRVIEASTQVDENNGFADSYVHAEGTSGGIKSNGLSVLHWKRDKDGRWKCMKHTILRGLDHHI